MSATISSIDWTGTRTPNKKILNHYFWNDTYTAILHDPWHKVYYRFMLQDLSGATQRTAPEDKHIIVMIMDENFNYLGETEIGTGKE